jgi:hypothetical protein
MRKEYISNKNIDNCITCSINKTLENKTREDTKVTQR